MTGDSVSEEMNSRTVQVRWIRSAIGFSHTQKQIVKSLGLRRLQQVVELPDTASVRGLVARVAHLVEIVPPAPQSHRASVPEYVIRAPEIAAEQIAAAPPPQAQTVEERSTELPGREESMPGTAPEFSEYGSEARPGAADVHE